MHSLNLLSLRYGAAHLRCRRLEHHNIYIVSAIIYCAYYKYILSVIPVQQVTSIYLMLYILGRERCKRGPAVNGKLYVLFIMSIRIRS